MLDEAPTSVTWPVTQYAYVEEHGPFMETAPRAWGTIHQRVPAIEAHNAITGYLSLYKPEEQLYRAGVALAAPPQQLPEGMQATVFAGGAYLRFVLQGAFDQLPAATSRAFEIVAARKLTLRDDFCIEHYVTDPRTTAVADLITEILLPVG